MVIFTLDSGLMIMRMVMENISIKMVLNISDNGLITCSMVMVMKLGKMDLSLSENTLKEQKMEKESLIL